MPIRPMTVENAKELVFSILDDEEVILINLISLSFLAQELYMSLFFKQYSILSQEVTERVGLIQNRF